MAIRLFAGRKTQGLFDSDRNFSKGDDEIRQRTAKRFYPVGEDPSMDEGNGQAFLGKGCFPSRKGKVEMTAVRSIQSNLCYSEERISKIRKLGGQTSTFHDR